MPFLSRIALAGLLLAGPALAEQPSYLRADQVPLTTLLAPFPPAGSAQDAAEMAEIMALARTRTPARLAQAQADVAETVYDMFGALLAPAVSPATAPLASHLFTRLEETEEAVNEASKKGFGRPRPYLANPALEPAAPRSRSGSYPSGHATRVRMMGIVLAAMIPEWRDRIFARVDEYAESRLVVGVHYRSDIVAGAQAGTAVAAVLMNDPGFRAEFGPARSELRALLGLP